MAEFSWEDTLYNAMGSVTTTPAGSSDPVCVVEAMYVTDSAAWGFHGYYPTEGNYATVLDASSAYEAPITQEDGSEKNESIDELSNLQKMVAEGSRRPNNQGVFISGLKYTMTRNAISGKPGDNEDLRKVVVNIDDEEQTVTFDRVFFLSSGEHQVVVAVDKQTYCYIAYANKKNCQLEQAHGAISQAIAHAAYYAGSGDE